MDIYIVALIAVAFYTFYLYLTRHRNYFKNKGIPHIPPFPILGDMKGSILRKTHFNEGIKEIYNLSKEAKYVGAFNFNTPIVLLRDLELIKSVTIKNFDSFADHNAFTDEKTDVIFSNNLFSMKGEKWKEARSLLSPAFTSSKMKSMFELMIPCAENFVKFIENKSESERHMIGTKDLFTKYTNDVIATCAFGISVDSLSDPNNDFYTLGKNATNLDGSLGLKMLVSRAFPRFAKLVNLKLINDETKNFFKNVVSTTIKTREEQGITRPDMIQLMMDARGKTSDILPLDLTQMTAQAFQFFFGGFDTTSTQMCIIAHVLAIHPEVQKKLQEEIDEVVERKIKQGKKVTYEDINSMQYLDAVFNETVRRHPQAPAIDRLCTKSFDLPPALPGLKAHTVKVGDTIWIPVAGIHSDPEYYENSDKFDPDRFFNKKSTTMQTTSLGFGIGPRICIGMRFAILEVKILMFYLLSKFNFKKNEKTADPFIYNPGTFSLAPKGGYWLAIEKRNI